MGILSSKFSQSWCSLPSIFKLLVYFISFAKLFEFVKASSFPIVFHIMAMLAVCCRAMTVCIGNMMYLGVPLAHFVHRLFTLLTMLWIKIFFNADYPLWSSHMSIKVPEIIGNSSVSSTICMSNKKYNIKASYYWSFVGQSIGVTTWFPSQRTCNVESTSMSKCDYAIVT